VLSVNRRSAASERIATLNQLRHLCFTADDQLRRRFADLSVARLTQQAASLRPRHEDPVRYSTLLAMRTLARRVAYLDDELDNLDVVRPLVERTAADLLAMHGVGYDVAAKLSRPRLPGCGRCGPWTSGDGWAHTQVDGSPARRGAANVDVEGLPLPLRRGGRGCCWSERSDP